MRVSTSAPANLTCCQRGDWDGCDHQPASAYLYVPTIVRPAFRGETQTVILPETTEDYRWECVYCGREGTAAELRA
jgi:hypothetical protein